MRLTHLPLEAHATGIDAVTPSTACAIELEFEFLLQRENAVVQFVDR
ncbi:MAG TPA: hypothetical protein VH583_01850 [Vicinamibacterales bacterium]